MPKTIYNQDNILIVVCDADDMEYWFPKTIQVTVSHTDGEGLQMRTTWCLNHDTLRVLSGYTIVYGDGHGVQCNASPISDDMMELVRTTLGEYNQSLAHI